MPSETESTAQLNSPNETTPHMLEIGAILHDQATGLLALLQVLNRGIESMGPNPFGDRGEPAPDEVNEALMEPVLKLSQSLNNLIQVIQHEQEQRKIPQDWWKEILELKNLLIEYPVMGINFRPPFLYLLARKLTDLLNDVKGAALPKERLREIQRNAKEVERIICMYDFSIGRSRILSMDHQIRTLREFLMSSVQPQEPRRLVRLQDMVRSVIHDLEAFSAEKRVKLNVKLASDPLMVEVSETDMRRALLNILHNAIKYSWRMSEDRLAWINVRCFAKEDYAQVEFENWGVPILKDEIEQQLVFQLGYRGAFSGDRGRLGTGIGLYDARKTALAHNGSIEIASIPARGQTDAETDPRKRPFITTVTLKIPIYAQDWQNSRT